MTELNLSCLDIIWWWPNRHNAHNRAVTRPVLGVTNYDSCSKLYWAIAEVDHKNIDIERIKNIAYLIVETKKGYHFYLKYSHPNPLRVIHTLFKYKWPDKGHLHLGLKRYRRTGDKRNGFLVLRISQKYTMPDLKIVYEAPELPLWHRQVKQLILYLNSLEVEKIESIMA